MYSLSEQDKERSITDYAPLVKRLAYHLVSRLPANVLVDDLIQIGMIGLLEAVNRYEENQGASFETYASQRIRGAMLDSLRETDWLPRSVRKELRRAETAIQKLEQMLGRAPSELEISQEMSIDLSDYHKLMLEAKGHQLLSLEDFSNEDGVDFLERYVSEEDVDPLSLLLSQDFKSTLVDAITALPQREQMVMGLYYEEELNLREIGEVLGVSESRVCQLHSQAINRLRAKIRSTT